MSTPDTNPDKITRVEERVPLDTLLLDPRFQPMPAYTPDQRTLLHEVMRRVGPDSLDPIVVDESLRVLDGHHRVQIARELDWTYILARVRVGYDDDSNYAYALSVNAARRDLTREQRRALTDDAVQRLGHLSDRALGVMCKVDHKTVKEARRRLFDATPQVTEDSGGENPQVARVGLDGKTYRVAKSGKPQTSAAKRQQQYDALVDILDRWERATFNPDVVSTAVRTLDREALRDRLQDLVSAAMEIADRLSDPRKPS
jgi:ParB-like chromosome segregation protein Spo0J